jgi:hypothetical protein
MSELPPPYFDRHGVSHDLLAKGYGVVYQDGQLHVVKAPKPTWTSRIIRWLLRKGK